MVGCSLQKIVLRCPNDWLETLENACMVQIVSWLFTSEGAIRTIKIRNTHIHSYQCAERRALAFLQQHHLCYPRSVPALLSIAKMTGGCSQSVKGFQTGLSY